MGNAGKQDYHIVAIGPPVSGKTVFLAALYYLFEQEQLARGVKVGMDFQHHARLRDLYDEVSNPSSAWPSGNMPGENYREFVFRCEVINHRSSFFGKSQTYRFPVFDFTYIDYSGEWVDDAGGQDEKVFGPFRARLEEADALLGFVDGVRLAEMMDRGVASKKHFRSQIQPIITQLEFRTAPSHLVLTKWDAVRDRYTLSDVGDYLLQIGGTSMRNFVTNRSSKLFLSRQGGVRLIPVSSVGIDFVKDGAKRADGVFTPMNVDVPLAACFIDILKLEMLRAEEELESRRGGDGGVSPSFDGGRMAATLWALDKAISSSRAVAGPPVAWASRSVRRQYRKARTRSIEGVNTPERALLHGVRAMDRIVQEFEGADEHQGSTLWLK